MRQSDYFQYYGMFAEGFGCFDCNDLFSLLQSKHKRCIRKDRDPKSADIPANETIHNCLRFYYDSTCKKRCFRIIVSPNRAARSQMLEVRHGNDSI